MSSWSPLLIGMRSHCKIVSPEHFFDQKTRRVGQSEPEKNRKNCKMSFKKFFFQKNRDAEIFFFFLTRSSEVSFFTLQMKTV